MSAFLKDASIELKKMVSHLKWTEVNSSPHRNPLQDILVRQNPSTYKLRYLLHLGDCCSETLHGVKHDISVLQQVSAWTSDTQSHEHLWNGGRPFEERLTELRLDLEYIQKELTNLETRVSSLKGVVNEHLAMMHDRRNLILTLLATVFLPLSFTSTFFGMNMDTMTSASPKGFSNWTHSWIENSPLNVQNQTRALASTIGSSGTLTYSWTVYMITAACLVLTLPLSLTVSGMIRTLIKSTADYSKHWRILALILSISFLVFSIFGIYMETFPTFVLSVICNAVLILFLIFRIRLARMEKRGRAYWVSYLVITVTFFAASLYFRSLLM